MADKSDYDFILAIGNPGGGDASYGGRVRGYVWEHDNSLETVGDNVSVADFEGRVAGGWDEYRVKGYVTEFNLKGQAQVEIDGNNISANDVASYRPDRFGDTSSGGTITIRDSGDQGKNHYRFVVSGDSISNSTANGASPSSGEKDRNANNDLRINDAVYGGSDSWDYDGEIVNLGMTNPSNAEINIGNGFEPADSFNFVYQISGGTSDSSGGDSTSSDDVSGSFDSDTGSGSTSGGGEDMSNLDPKHGRVNRDPVSDDNREQTVGAGGDVGTVQGGINTMARVIEHKDHLQLQKGKHSSEPGDSVNIPSIQIASAHGSLKVKGDKDNPEDYVLDLRQFNAQFLPGTAQNVAIEGITLRGTFQVRQGAVEVDSCIIEGGERWGKGDAVPIDSYGGHVQILGGTVIKSSGAGINLVEGVSVSVGSDTTFDVDGPLFTTGQHGGEVVFNGNADISTNQLTKDGWEPAPVRVYDTHGAVDGMKEGSNAIIHR